jgi:hypothetical protein
VALADGASPSHDLTVQRNTIIGGATAIGIALLGYAGRRFGPRSSTFAFTIVWVPMTWLGTVSRVAQPRLPTSCHELRAFERDGRVYEIFGVKIVKQLLRRGPIAFFNPDLHLPVERSPERLAHLEQRMKDAEASHAILLVGTLPIVLHAASRKWWKVAGATLMFDVALNGYPVMLQRYNRARLRQRFPTTPFGTEQAHMERTG